MNRPWVAAKAGAFVLQAALLGLGATIVLASIPSVSSAISTGRGLIHLEANFGPVENGKTLKMEFDEIERDGDESRARVTFHSGGSVSSTMFILSGMCAIARSRGTKFFRKISDSDDGDTGVYVIGFADDLNGAGLKLPPGKHGHRIGDDSDADDETVVWSRSDCELLGFAH